MFAAPDYKALYFELFRASEQAARLLWEAQQKAEQEALRADPPPLELEPLRHRSRDATFPTLSLLRHLSPAGESLSSKWEALAVPAAFTVLPKALPSGELARSA